LTGLNLGDGVEACCGTRAPLVLDDSVVYLPLVHCRARIAMRGHFRPAIGGGEWFMHVFKRYATSCRGAGFTREQTVLMIAPERFWLSMYPPLDFETHRRVFSTG
jgi:hypothetical protein